MKITSCSFILNVAFKEYLVINYFINKQIFPEEIRNKQKSIRVNKNLFTKDRVIVDYRYSRVSSEYIDPSYIDFILC